MPSKKLIDVLKSGNFTIVYHDNGMCNIYSGKHKDYDSAVESYDEGKCDELWSSNYQPEGYTPEEVILLVKALGGKVFSI